MSIKSNVRKVLNIIFNSKKVPVAKLVYTNKMLDGKTALITGGSSGIGFSIAEEFVKNGCKVIICGRNIEKINSACKLLGEKAKGLKLDVSKVCEIESKIEEAANLFEKEHIDILINSAGIGAINGFFDVSEKEYDDIMDINMKGTFFMSKYMAKYMIKNKIKGHILNISSSSALRPAWTPYEISKWGIKGFTVGAADSLSKYGIVVNAIAPGPTATPMLKKNKKDNIYTNTTNTNRMALPNEISSLAVYMCSDIGEMIIGETFYITGGAGNIINRFD